MTTANEPLDIEQRKATTRTVAMPADTNPAGDIFGGWVLSQMDIAGGIAGSQRAQGRVVTVAIDGMNFIKPVKVGDILAVYTSISRTGKSSMDILVEAWVRRGQIGTKEKVTQATFTFVAVDEAGKPVILPAENSIPSYDKG